MKRFHIIRDTIMSSGMCQRRGQGGGQLPPQILADQKVPPAAAVRRITTCPPQIFRLWTMPAIDADSGPPK